MDQQCLCCLADSDLAVCQGCAETYCPGDMDTHGCDED
jgi:hypothetical protein